MKMHVTNMNWQYAVSNFSRYTEGHHTVIRTDKDSDLFQGSSINKVSLNMFLVVEI